MSTEKESKKYKAITEISKRFGGCFGSADMIFASHQLDEEHAKELRDYALKNELTLMEMENIICGHIYRLGLLPQYEKQQRDKAIKFFSKKLK